MRLQGIQGITYSYLRSNQPTQTPITTNPSPSTQTAKIAFGRANAEEVSELSKQIAKLCAYKEINGAPIKDNTDCSLSILKQISDFEKKFNLKIRLTIGADKKTPESKSIATITTSRSLWPFSRDIEKVEFRHPDHVERIGVKGGTIAGHSTLQEVEIPIIKAVKCSVNGTLGRIVFN